MTNAGDRTQAGPSAQPALARRLGTSDATVIGLSSMIGAGVFAVFAPAAEAAGAGLLIGLAVAAVVAYCNATASAQLAAEFPTSGGTYVYGRQMLGPWWGFLAGWGFVIGKTASCAAMALTFAAYALPGDPGLPQRLLAAGAVAALAALNYRGITRTAGLARIIVSVVLVAIAVSVAAGLFGGHPDLEVAFDSGTTGWTWYGVAQSAGLIFFAFAGYARIATLAEEVRDPTRTIPRAILIALGATVTVYTVVALTLLLLLGPDGMAGSTAPVAEAVTAGSWDWAAPVARIGAASASLGALLALIAGVGRTGLAMAREGDLPRWLAAVHPRHRVPHHAEIALAGAVIVLVSVVDLRAVIGFSSFGVLLYYLIANLSAFRQAPDQRRFPRWLQILGAVGCAALALTLPWPSVVAGIAVIAVGVGGRLAVRRSRAA
jgi:basic amino acid/polyamine antiporter, APA family